MGWALLHISKLKLGETVSFRPKGNSMQRPCPLGAFYGQEGKDRIGSTLHGSTY